MEYNIEITGTDGRKIYKRLTARTDRGAVRQLRAYSRKIRYLSDGKTMKVYYLRWDRESDGCSGYINPDGNASPVGKAWM